MSKRNETDKHWLQALVEKNFTQLIVFIVGLATTLAIIKTSMDNLTERVSALEAKQDAYPSQDWFELKFDTIEDKIDKLDRRVDEVSELRGGYTREQASHLR